MLDYIGRVTFKTLFPKNAANFYNIYMRRQRPAICITQAVIEAIAAAQRDSREQRTAQAILYTTLNKRQAAEAIEDIQALVEKYNRKVEREQDRENSSGIGTAHPCNRNGQEICRPLSTGNGSSGGNGSVTSNGVAHLETTDNEGSGTTCRRNRGDMKSDGDEEIGAGQTTCDVDGERNDGDSGEEECDTPGVDEILNGEVRCVGGTQGSEEASNMEIERTPRDETQVRESRAV